MAGAFALCLVLLLLCDLSAADASLASTDADAMLSSFLETAATQAPFDPLSTLPYRIDMPRGTGPVYDNSRVFPSPCSTCEHFTSSLAKIVLNQSIVGNTTAIAVQAQIICTQDGLAPSLKVECNRWTAITDFLKSLGFFSDKKSDIIALKFYPRSYCTDINRCVPASSGQEEQIVGPKQFAIVRMKLLKNVTTIFPPAHKSWPVFVKLFLDELAEAVGVSPERLELHFHPVSPNIAEVVVKPKLNPLQRLVDSHKKTHKEEVMGDDPVDFVADRIKRKVETGKLNRNPQRITSLIDTAFQVQVFIMQFDRAFKYFNGLVV